MRSANLFFFTQPQEMFEAWNQAQQNTPFEEKEEPFFVEIQQQPVSYGSVIDTSYADSLYWKEQHLYGSSRLGIAKPELEVTNYKNSNFSLLTSNFKNYELTNHLGNVLATIKDEKQQIDANADGIVDYYEPIVITANDYYPFGMIMPNRSFSLAGSGYRFGFNSQEKDDEVYGKGNLMTAKFWEYDARIGRRWNRDPKYTAFESRYVVNSNNPIHFTDPNGDFRTKFFANIARAVDKLLGKEVGDVYKNDRGQFGYAVNGGGNGWGHKFGTRGNGGKGGNGGITASHPGIGDKKATISGNKSIFANTYTEFNAGFAFGGGIGFSIGKVYDHQGNSKWYGSFSGNLGLYAGAGFNEGKIIPTNSSHKFVNSDFEGEGKSYSAGYGIFGGSYGGSWLEGSERKDHPEDQFNPARFGLNNTNTQTGGYTTLSGGLSKGPGLKIGGAYSHTKTWLFSD